MMEIAKEDLQYIRQHIAERHGAEMTPQEVLDILREVEDIEVVSEPGLVTMLRELRKRRD